eukprot:4949811-Prymnesium_polylepis.2
MSALNLKPQIKTVDMSEEMTEFAIETATFALGEYNIESLMANHIKRARPFAARAVASPDDHHAACAIAAGLAFPRQALAAVSGS